MFVVNREIYIMHTIINKQYKVCIFIYIAREGRKTLAALTKLVHALQSPRCVGDIIMQ